MHLKPKLIMLSAVVHSHCDSGEVDHHRDRRDRGNNVDQYRGDYERHDDRAPTSNNTSINNSDAEAVLRMLML